MRSTFVAAACACGPRRTLTNLRASYPKFIGSQYAPDLDAQRDLFPILHQDLTMLNLPSASFDVAITIEVLEHVPDLEAALGELARILKPGGLLLSAFPFDWTSHATQRRAMLRDDKIVHFVDEPEYLGDPMRSEGILVFQISGWDIVDIARQAGFKDASLIFYSSAIGGIFGSDIVGRFVFVAYR